MNLPVDFSGHGPTVTTTCYCRCGGVWRSHAKTANIEGRWRCYSQRACPQCGKHDDVYRVASDPESYTLRKEDIG